MRLLPLICSILSVLVCVAASSFQQTSSTKYKTDCYGAVIEMAPGDTSERPVYLIFTADSLFEGGNFALDVLRESNAKASFFFTGNFLRDSLRNKRVIDRVIDDGHYVGAHGDRHILLADWDDKRTTLASADSALRDMQNCMVELSKYGIDPLEARYVVPSFEWYNAEHTDIFRRNGFVTVSLSPGLLTYLDYTIPEMSAYCTSDSIWDNFVDNLQNDNLLGKIILIHLGTQPERHDKFYRRLPEMIDSLLNRGYTLQRF